MDGNNQETPVRHDVLDTVRRMLARAVGVDSSAVVPDTALCPKLPGSTRLMQLRVPQPTRRGVRNLTGPTSELAGSSGIASICSLIE